MKKIVSVISFTLYSSIFVANVSTNVFEEFVDNLSSVSSFKVIYKLTELDTSVKQLAKITNEPQVLTENFDSNILKIPNLAKSPKSNSDPIIVVSVILFI